MRRLLLVRHAPTASTRSAAFPLDEALDDRARAQAARLADVVPARGDVLCSPPLRGVHTAGAEGLDATPEPRVAECDFGSWAGRSLADVHASEPQAARPWLTDPRAGPHGGECLADFSARVRAWLDDQTAQDGPAVVITHGGVVKAAVVHAMGAPLGTFLRVDAAPLAVTELHAHDGRWTITRVNGTAPGASAAAD